MRVWEQANLYYIAALHGKLLLPEYSPQLDQGIMFGTQPILPQHKTSIMRAPKLRSKRYCCCIHDNTTGTFFDSDAVLLSKADQSVAFATSDCGASILYAKDTGDVLLAHTGRNQLMDADHPLDRTSILKACVALLYDRGAAYEAIHSLSVSQIAAAHFAHRGHKDETLVRTQATLWGEAIMPDPERATLDLVQLIATQLAYYGVPKSNITRFRINPYTSPDLSSKRAGKLGSNVITLTRPKSTPTVP
jgi:copper oxidase (laccase) domain-containing protein